MDTVYWIAGVSVASIIAEKVMKEFGNETKANFINMATNLIVLTFIVKMIFSLFSITKTLYSGF